jgi:hypothetical protein
MRLKKSRSSSRKLALLLNLNKLRQRMGAACSTQDRLAAPCRRPFAVGATAKNCYSKALRLVASQQCFAQKSNMYM